MMLSHRVGAGNGSGGVRLSRRRGLLVPVSLRAGKDIQPLNRCEWRISGRASWRGGAGPNIDPVVSTAPTS